MTSSLISACAALCLCAATASCMSKAESAEQMSTSQQNKAQPANPQPENKQPRAPVDPNKFAVIIAGVGGDEAYTKKFTAQAAGLYTALTERLGFDAKNVSLLTELVNAGPENSAPGAATPPSRRATAEEVKQSFAAIKAAAKADSVVAIFLIGHGSFDNQAAKFNLLGPDLAAKDYAQLIGAIPSRRVIFVNCSSSSGEFVKPLSGDNRIIITATRSGTEQNATVFAEYFIAGLTSPEADTDKSGRVSVMEAFDYATKLVADFYKKDNRLATEHAMIDDNGDGAGHETATAGDGALAKTTYFDSKSVEQASGDAELLRLAAEKQKLEEEIEKLKARKDRMKEEDYERELERLLVELAKVNQTIRSRQK
jgi:hypothetical protein